MAGVAAALVLIALVGLQFGVTYVVATRTGLYRWAQDLFPPRRNTPRLIRLHKVGALCLCFVLMSIPLQGGLLILAGIAAAIGVL